MMRIMKKRLKEKEVQELEKIEPDTWIELIKPDTKEISDLAKELNVPIDFLNAGLDEDEKPRIDDEDGVKLFILQVPSSLEGVNGTIIGTIPLGIVFSKEHIITVSLNENVVLADFRKGKIKHFSTAKKTRMLFQIMDHINHYYIKYLDRIDKDIIKTERILQKSFENKELIGLLELQKSLVYFSSATMSNKNVIHKITKGKVIKLYEEDEDLIDEVVIESEQTENTVKILSDVLSGTMDAYASIISNNLNIVMKFLASITLILMGPSIVSGFYGMNVSLPMQNDPNAFTLLFIFSFFLSIGLTIFFWLKKWL